MSNVAVPGVVAASRRRTAAGTPTVLGYSTRGSISTGMGAGYMHVASYTLAGAGTLTELHGWFVGATGAAIRVVIYDDDGSSALPGTRLAYTNSFALPASGDYHAAETGLSVPLTAGNYWVGFISQAALGLFTREGSGATHQQITSGATYTPPPNPFGTPSSSGTRMVSCWGIVLV